MTMRRQPSTVTVLLSCWSCMLHCAEAQTAACERGRLLIGGPSSFSGGSALPGEMVRNAAHLWAEKVNATGGLTAAGCPNPLPVELIFEDDRSATQEAERIMQSFVDSGRVDFFLAPYGSGLTGATAPISQQAGMIMMAPTAATPTIYSQGLSYLFGLSSLAPEYMSGGLVALRDAGAATAAFVSNADSSFSSSTCSFAQAQARELGYQILSSEFYDGSLDFSQIVSNLLNLQQTPDVLVSCGHIEDAVVLAATAKTLEFNPGAFLVTQTSTVAFMEALNAVNAQHFIGPVQWGSFLSYEDALFGNATEYAEDYEARFGVRPSYQAAASSAALYALGLAIEAAATLTSAAVRDALQELDAPSFYGRLKFGDNGVIDSVGKPMATVQIQGGSLRVVHPELVADATVAYPRMQFQPLSQQIEDDPLLLDSVPVTELLTLASWWVRRSANIVEYNFQEIYNSEESYGDCPHTPACPWDEATTPTQQYDPWPFRVTFERPSLRFVEGSSMDTAEMRRSICLAADSRPLVREWQANWELLGQPTDNVGYQMYGHQETGMLSIWPGKEYCQSYDARFRPWYAAAASGPKDLIVVIDTSGSMTRAGRLAAAIEAVDKVLDTLIWADFATVVTFSSDSEAFGDGLLYQMTDANKTSVKRWVANLHAAGYTNYQNAFTRAFSTLVDSQRQRRTSRCNSLILFMSDGEVTEGASGAALLETIRVQNVNDINANIFTYQFGSGFESVLLRQIACAHSGIWFEVPDGGDLASIMASYYKYFAATSTITRPKWITYNFASTGQPGISGCMPAYDYTRTPKELIGVTCVDMNVFGEVSALESRADWRVFEMKMIGDTQECPTTILSEEDLESLRAFASQPSAQCALVPDVDSAAIENAGYSRLVTLSTLVFFKTRRVH